MTLLPAGSFTVDSDTQITIDPELSGLNNGPAGVRQIRVGVDADGPFSNAKPLTIYNVPAQATTTAVVSSDLSADQGDSVTFTATVSLVAGGGFVTAGSVTFKRGTTTLASGVLVNSSGVATFTTSALPVGSWSITAQYTGSSAYQNSTSTAITQVINFAGGPPATTASLVSSDYSSAPGQPVTFTCTVTRTSGGLPATSGSVIFKDGATTLATVAVDSSGVATYTTSALALGDHTMTGEYSGGGIFGNCTSNSMVQSVNTSSGAPISQVLQISKPTALYDEVVTIKSFVTSSGSPVTYGTVNFKEGATVIGSSIPTDYGEFCYTFHNQLAVGAHTIVAEYVPASSAYESDTTGPQTITIVASLPTPPVTDWAAVKALGDKNVTRQWYQYNCGWLSEGFDPADLWTPAGTYSDGVTVDATWLTANEGAMVVDDGGGHWTVTGLHCSALEVEVSNITFEHCWIDRVDYATVWDSGVRPAATVLNVVFNHCTISTDGTASSGTWGDAQSYVQTTPTANGVTYNYCEATQWRACFLMWHGTNVNYCWVHDLNLFGDEPHNTAASIRGRYCNVYRCYFTDGTSSNISLYADTTPYTDFTIRENILEVLPSHASAEINFPTRSTGWSPLLAGYVRECTDNSIERGGCGDNIYWSKISGNTYYDVDDVLFGAAETVMVATEPGCLGTAMTPFDSSEQTITSYAYTPTASSVLLLWHGIGRAGHEGDPNVSIVDTSGGSWFLVPDSETGVENAPGDEPRYGLAGSLWRQTVPAGTPAFRTITIDPYSGLTLKAYQAGLIVELTGIGSLTTVQTPVISVAGHDLPFGDSMSSIASGTLAANCTSGNLVLCFVAWLHEEFDVGLAKPAGWNIMGNDRRTRSGVACFWRKDFTGRSLIIPSVSGATGNAVTLLMELDV